MKRFDAKIKNKTTPAMAKIRTDLFQACSSGTLEKVVEITFPIGCLMTCYTEQPSLSPID